MTLTGKRIRIVRESRPSGYDEREESVLEGWFYVEVKRWYGWKRWGHRDGYYGYWGTFVFESIEDARKAVKNALENEKMHDNIPDIEVVEEL